MNRSRITQLGAVALTLALFVPALASARDMEEQSSGARNSRARSFFDPRPVLLYALFDATTMQNGGSGNGTAGSGSGSSGTGGTGTQTAQIVVVYDNGVVLATNGAGGTGTTTSGTGSSTAGAFQTALITQAEVRGLFDQLRHAGALRQSSGPATASTNGSLLATVTLFTYNNGNGNNGNGLGNSSNRAIATTFSFFDDATGAGANVFNILGNFTTTSFGGSGK